MSKPLIELESETPSRRAWQALITVLSGTFMAIVDSTIVNVALPSIRSSIHPSAAQIEWIVSGYLLAFGLMLIPAGRLGDRYGHKPLFVTGLSLFVISSVICGSSINASELVTARIVQGASAGLFGPSIQATISLLFAGKARSRAFGILGTIIGISSASGPVIGGLIIVGFGSNVGWRLVFFVNLLIGIFAIPLAIRLIPNVKPNIKNELDLVGLTIVTAALSFVFIFLIEGGSTNFPLWTIEVAITSLPAFGAFYLWEKRYQRRGHKALVDGRLARSRSFSIGIGLAMIYFSSFSSIFVVISLIWQDGLHRDALASGLTVTPFAIGTLIFGSISDRFSSKLGKGTLYLGIGLLFTSISVAEVILRLSTMHHISALYLTIPLFIGGIGNGIFIAPNQDFLLRSIERKDAGVSAALLQTSQRIGSALSVAASVTIFFNSLAHGSTYLKAGGNALIFNLIMLIIGAAITIALPKPSVGVNH
ncbi:MAG: MFS transporter [Actinomycetota bacterium]|nr:MFS transporter [Actinomycetota bacterium]